MAIACPEQVTWLGCLYQNRVGPLDSKFSYCIQPWQGHSRTLFIYIVRHTRSCLGLYSYECKVEIRPKLSDHGSFSVQTETINSEKPAVQLREFNKIFMFSSDSGCVPVTPRLHIRPDYIPILIFASGK